MVKRFEKAKYYTEKYKSISLPCKHCGNTDIRIVSDRTGVIGETKDGWSVVCATKSCDCTNIYTSVKKAIEIWNNRQVERK